VLVRVSPIRLFFWGKIALMETIGLIAAMPSETAALLRLVQGWERIKVASCHGIRFRLADWDCVLVTSGMGVRRAYKAARILIETFNPTCLISFGIAGAVSDELKIGDVVMIKLNCTLEKGVLSSLRALVPLSTQSWELAEHALGVRGARLVPGTAVTTHGTQLSPRQCGELLDPVLEMETAGILQAATESRIPLIALRSISDGPQAPIPFNMEMVMDENYNIHLNRMLSQIMKHPRLLLQIGQITRNSRIAADHAGIALVAVLTRSASRFSA
jgi:adenosylhomocysteine nucleosidase